MSVWATKVRSRPALPPRPTLGSSSPTATEITSLEDGDSRDIVENIIQSLSSKAIRVKQVLLSVSKNLKADSWKLNS